MVSSTFLSLFLLHPTTLTVTARPLRTVTYNLSWAAQKSVCAGSEEAASPKLLWGVILARLKGPQGPLKEPYAGEYIAAREQRESARLCSGAPSTSMANSNKKRRGGSHKKATPTVTVSQ